MGKGETKMKKQEQVLRKIVYEYTPKEFLRKLGIKGQLHYVTNLNTDSNVEVTIIETESD